MLKEGLISGSPDEKEEAARVLIEVIHLSSSKTLSTGKVVMLIAGPLIRVLGDRYGWSVKVATLEALVELIRKVHTHPCTVDFVAMVICLFYMWLPWLPCMFITIGWNSCEIILTSAANILSQGSWRCEPSC